MQKPILSLIVFSVLFGGVALANQLVGLGASYWSHEQALNATTAACIEQSDNSTCQLFAAGTDRAYIPRALVATTTGDATCCFVYDSSLDIATSGQVTDAAGPNGTGDGDCFQLPAAGSVWQGQTRRAFHQDLAGYRGGLCPNRTTVHSTFGVTESLHAPCASGACAAAFGGGTCNTSPTSSMLQHAGVFMVCEGTNIRVNKEKVPGWDP